jgi:hypothetical protein
MSDSEVKLRAQLAAALDEFSPGPLPLDSVVRQGKTVKVRRRVSAVVAVLLVVAVALSAPALAHRFGRQAPVTPGRYHVTVSPPGPHSPRDLVARGRIDDKPWSVIGWLPNPESTIDACFQASRVVCHGVVYPADYDRIASFPLLQVATEIGRAPIAVIGYVHSDVRFVRLKLSNGQTLTLRPVAVFGKRFMRYVAIEVPFAAAITQVQAYSATRLLGYAVPFASGGSFQLVRWLKPGQAPLPRPAVYQIGSGIAAGRPWSLRAHVGPWGTCLTGIGDLITCHPTSLAGLRDGKPAALVEAAAGPHDTSFGVLVASAGVSYFRLSTTEVTFTTDIVNGVRFVSFTSKRGNAVTRWAAYSARGQRLASGSVR